MNCESFDQFLLPWTPLLLGTRNKVHESVSLERGPRVQPFFPKTFSREPITKAIRTDRIIELIRAVRMTPERGPVSGSLPKKDLDDCHGCRALNGL